MLPRPAAIVFDLDGTLVDSLRDIGESLNWCLELLGVDARPISSYQYMVGEGVPTLCRRAIGPSHPHLVDRLIELARPLYRTRVVVHTRPYPGIADLVAALRERGVPLGVLSNKPHDLTLRVIDAFWPDGTFAARQGYVDERYRKPSPHHLLEMCAVLGASPATTWLVGDTPTDIATAKAAGAVPIGVTWGFRTRDDLLSAGAKHLIDAPAALLTLL
jgi:phosphoglycolate phosphatase